MARLYGKLHLLFRKKQSYQNFHWRFIDVHRQKAKTVESLSLPQLEPFVCLLNSYLPGTLDP